MSIVVYQDVATPIIPSGDLAGPVRDALGGSLRSMRYVTPDFAGLYQDAAGTTPVTAVGQPVGLMLDRRFGLARGAEEWQAPFSTNGAASESGGVVSFSAAAQGSYVRATKDPYLGRVFEFSFRVVSMSGGSIRLYLGSTIPVLASAPGVYRGVSVFGDGTSIQFFSLGTSTTATIDNITVREIPGNHASQTTAPARPFLQTAPLRIDYDGVDDYLRTVFPALGSNVTIARSIPGVGAQYLTGQTIAAGNWDDNVDSCATLVIDRALTGPETALVTAFLNQQAGV